MDPNNVKLTLMQKVRPLFKAIIRSSITFDVVLSIILITSTLYVISLIPIIIQAHLVFDFIIRLMLSIIFNAGILMLVAGVLEIINSQPIKNKIEDFVKIYIELNVLRRKKKFLITL